MYNEFKSLNLQEIDKEILAFWEAEDVFNKSVQQRPTDNSWVFYEGPPSANGKPGIHHVMARAIKDIFCRYQTLKGKRVERKGGWDTHGLPIELSVEKELGITKEDIGKTISVDEYNHKCRETVMRYKSEWDDITRQMGYWVDLENPYITYENEYIETVWWLIKRLYDKGLLYKGYTIQPYSPAAGTGLSSHELNMPGAYKEVTDTTVVAMFKVIRDDKSDFLFDSEDKDVRILAWTTTPWTLPSNTALTVGPKIDYVKIKTLNPYTHEPVSVVLADVLVGNWFATDPEKQKNKPAILEKSKVFKGAALNGVRFEQLLPFGNPIEDLNGHTDAFRVVVGDFVTTEDGTGVVHTAPSFGADDMKAARANGIGTLTLVDKQGKFKDSVGEFSNRYVKNYKDDPDYVSVDVDIAVRLKLEGNALNVTKYVHNYPHCWRTDKPVLYYPLDSWFIKASALKERMFELNQTINWKPASTGEGRFGKWLENLQDWNLSRSRYWGIPLPIWRTEDGDQEVCVGTVADLKAKAEDANQRITTRAVQEILSQQEIDAIIAGHHLSLQPDFDLHRPYIDQVVLLSEDGRSMYRELDLIDVWFDSGSMPYAQWGLDMAKLKAGDDRPFKAPFDNMFPADFIAEGVDQTRGWFYTLHAIAVMAFDSVSFKNVVSNGLVLDKNGNKMSKRLGNAADPFETIAKYGADATRWYMISNAAPWDNLKFDVEGIAEVQRKFFGTLFNTYNFFALYANVDGWKMDEFNVTPCDQRTELDRWVISKLYSLVADYHAVMDDYEPHRACRLVEDFVDEHLSNWYVRLSRRRFWRGEISDDKEAAYQTLFECLMVVGQLSSTVAPFFSDWLYRNLTAPIKDVAKQKNTPLRHDSVHLTDLTKPEASKIDKALEKRMDYAQRICSLAFSIRKANGLRVRLPLQKLLLPVLDESFIKEVEGVKDLILNEINVKEIEYITDASGLLKKQAKANFKTLGAKLGKDMKGAAERIAAFSNEEINALEKAGSMPIEVNGTTYDLVPADLIVTTEDLPGWKVASDGSLTVALDVTLSEALETEGLARDLVNRIQNIRKDRDFNVTDRISVRLERHEAIAAVVEQFGDYIKSETLAQSIALEAGFEGTEKVELPGELMVGIEVSQFRA
ncbi:MAG: isoleucine--tRNA ligase [Saprospiraceae bacterium]|nr:isoleucine--tRNA ligase [Saprospiraceae bacterium]MDZ4705378.1 isoleucine--tRNA ligase [Saprospiraceae bacterium]